MATKPPLRVAHVTATFPPYRGGIGNVAYQNVLELQRLGHHVDVFTPHSSARASDSVEDVTVHRLRSMVNIKQASFTPALLWRLRRYDIVHLHCPFVLGAELVWLAAQIHRVPYVVTYHQDLMLDGALAPVGAAYQWVEERVALSGARWVAATSEDYAKHSALTRISRDRVVVLPNGTNTDAFRPGLDVRALRDRYGIENEPVVLFVGGLDKAHYFKGIPILLKAAAQLPNARFVIVGDGDMRSTYEAAARDLGIADRVQFAGFVDEEDLPSYYNLADIVVLPSTTRGEAFGMVLVEAMACGVPVVASNLPGVRSVVQDGIDGLLVTPGDTDALANALGKLLADPARRAIMGAAGRKKAESTYDWRLIGPLLERLYFRALGINEGASLVLNQQSR